MSQRNYVSHQTWLVAMELEGGHVSPERRAEPASEIEALMITPPGFEPPESYESRVMRSAELHEAMRSLNDEERFLIEAYFYENLSFRQIGRRMQYGVPPNWGKSTAERKVKKAVEKLRRQYGVALVSGVGKVQDGRSATVQDGATFSEDGVGDAGATSVDDSPAERCVGKDPPRFGAAEGEADGEAVGEDAACVGTETGNE